MDEPEAIPREMSSRSASVSVRGERRRAAGTIPPRCVSKNRMEPWPLPKVRPISCNDSPAFQRRHMSIRCSAESLSRFPCAINTTFRKNDSYQMVLHRPVEPAYVFGNAPGDYQSTPPNFPPQPQFTHWSHVTPFTLEHANQFRPGPPPALTSDKYSDAFNQVKSLGMLNSTTATADQVLIGQFWNGAIQNYWNEITQTASVAHGLTTSQNARFFALLNLSLSDSGIAFSAPK